jgi:hypothetical protein
MPRDIGRDDDGVDNGDGAGWLKVTIRLTGPTTARSAAAVLLALESFSAEAYLSTGAYPVRSPIVVDAERGSILLTVLVPIVAGAKWFIEKTQTGKVIDEFLARWVRRWLPWPPSSLPPHRPQEPPPTVRVSDLIDPKYPDQAFGKIHYRIASEIDVEVGPDEQRGRTRVVIAPDEPDEPPPPPPAKRKTRRK